MPDLRKTSRRPCRTVISRHWRSLNRAHVRPLGGCERGPDYLTQMLASFRRAIRAYRRLAKLAPSYYDPAVVDREKQFREEQRRRMASWEPALEKAYGPPTPEEREARRQADWLAEQPRPLHPRTQRAVDCELENYEFWKAAGKLSQARYQEFQRRRPHDLPSLGKIARLMEIAFDFGWIATGRDWRNPEPAPPTPPPSEQDFEADLRRAYGGSQTKSSNVGRAFQPAGAGDFLVARPTESNVAPKPHTASELQATPPVNHAQTAAAGSPTSTAPVTPDTEAQPVHLVVGMHGLVLLATSASSSESDSVTTGS